MLFKFFKLSVYTLFEFRSGYYRNAEDRGQKEGYWSYEEIDDKYKSTNDKYDPTNWNCGHFAKDLFHKL